MQGISRFDFQMMFDRFIILLFDGCLIWVFFISAPGHWLFIPNEKNIFIFNIPTIYRDNNTNGS